VSRSFFVYILSSTSRTLYIGVTGDLVQRMLQHRKGLISGFSTRYKIFRLVHFEQFSNVHEAIAREKEIKKWRREKKVLLIESTNPSWEDLASQFPHKYRPG
jgi:putative endonuclease